MTFFQRLTSGDDKPTQSKTLGVYYDGELYHKERLELQDSCMDLLERRFKEKGLLAYQTVYSGDGTCNIISFKVDALLSMLETRKTHPKLK